MPMPVTLTLTAMAAVRPVGRAPHGHEPTSPAGVYFTELVAQH
jgi:hypothetical protein